MEEKTTCTLFSFIDEFLYFYSLKRTWWHVEEMESKCSNQARNSWSCEKTVCQAWLTCSHTPACIQLFKHWPNLVKCSVQGSCAENDITQRKLAFQNIKVCFFSFLILKGKAAARPARCCYTLLEAGFPQTLLDSSNTPTPTPPTPRAK